MPSVLAEARRLDLANTEDWRRLVHYRTSFWGKTSSQVDGDEFFLAPHGKRTPEGELEATLAAFFAPAVAGREDEHASCRFPARLLWLDAQLHFIPRVRLPRCPALDRYYARTDVESVTFVYVGNLLENPASATGHTFLRLVKKRAPGVTTPHDELDSSVDFSAVTDTKNPLLYAIKGVGGMFQGRFKLHPFEELARRYTLRDGRDFWEYELALTPSEVALLVRHLWELAGTHIDYYYLSGNCSYHLMTALEAAAPRLHFLARLNAVVLPSDALKIVYETPGLVRRVWYRPAVVHRFDKRFESLRGLGRDTVSRLIHDPEAPLPAELSSDEQAFVLETAAIGVEALHAKELFADQAPKAVVAAIARLTERRKAFSQSTDDDRASVPLGEAPQLGHRSMRATFGAGMATQYGPGFLTLGYRLALHDLTDASAGEPELLQLQFLDARFRYDVRSRSATVDGVTFAELMALKPITRFELPISWRARALGERVRDAGCRSSDCFVHGLDGSVGATIATDSHRVVFFLMADVHVLFGDGQLDGIGGSFVRAGIGPYAGLRLRLPLRTIALLTGRWSYLPAENLFGTYDARAVVRTALGRDVALGLEGLLQPRAAEAQLVSSVYF